MAESPLSLSLTQTSEKSPHIFVDPSGSPLSVFLEVNSEIPARPRLIRLLRASGADISHNPSDADILLINSDTDSGLKFVHDWKADPHKTFLKYHWIQACIRAGRALLEAENWGGFRVFHASNCVYSDEEGDEGLEVAQSETRPLTTLQHTLDERAIPSTPPFGSKASLNPTHLKPPPPARPWSRQSAKLNTPSLAPRSPIPSSRSVSNSMPAQSQSPSNLNSSTTKSSSPKFTAGISTQTTSIHRHSAPAIPPKHTILNSRSPQQSSAPRHPFLEAADTPTLAPSLSRITEPSMSQNQNFPLAVNNSEPQHSPPAGSIDLLNVLNYAFQIQNTASQVQNAASQTLTQLVETIIAVAQVQGMDTAIIQNYLATLPMSSQHVQLSPSLRTQEPALHPVGQHAGSSVPDSSFGDVGKDSASTRTPRSHAPPGSALPAKRKRKSPERPPSPKRATPNSRQNPSGAFVGPPSEGSVFSAKNGRPILVFVQIDIRGRHEIVHLIKKNGGKITADIPNANFVILNPRSVSYTDLRQEADDSGRTIVQTSFITESIKQGRLLNPSDFLLGGVSSPKKVNRGRGRPSSFRDRHSLESDLATPEAQAPERIVDASSPSKPIPTRKRFITPEPPAAVQMKNGYKFTPAEMTYTWVLVRRIITKDPFVSKLTVTKALHEKMPHHPMSSWTATMTRHKDMYESVRAAALGLTTSGRNTPNSQQRQDIYHSLNESSDVGMIEAGRDAEELEELQVGASLVMGEDESMHDDELQPPLEEGNEDRNEPDAYARDFEAIVEFLISPDADTGQEDEIFERLTAKSICITAPSWSVFLDKYGEAVKEEVDRRYRAQHHE